MSRGKGFRIARFQGFRIFWLERNKGKYRLHEEKRWKMEATGA